MTSTPVPLEEPGPASLAAGQPNVVVITLDDMREDDLRFMPRTQELIGGQGVTFDERVLAVPALLPVSLLVPHRSVHAQPRSVVARGRRGASRPCATRQTLPVWLQAAGYDTVVPRQVPQRLRHPARTRRQRDRTRRPTCRRAGPTGGERSTAGSEAGHPQDGGTYRFFNTTLNDNGQFYLEPGRYQSEVFGDLTAGIVAERAGDDRPFFLWANYVAPHHGNPGEPDDPKPITRDDGKVTRFVTTARPARVKGMFDARRHARRPGRAASGDVSDKPFFVRDLPPLNNAELAGLLEVTRQRAEALAVVDEQVEKTVTALEASGELDDTLILFTSDTGYFLGEHRIRQGKVLPYEPSLAVPLLAAAPASPPARSAPTRSRSMDFAPTILRPRPQRRSTGRSTAGPARRRPQGDQRLAAGGADRDRATRRGRRPRRVRTGPEGQGPGARREAVLPGHPHRALPLRRARQRRGRALRHEGRPRPGRQRGEDPAYAEDRVALAGVLDRMRGCRGGGCSTLMPRSLRVG